MLPLNAPIRFGIHKAPSPEGEGFLSKKKISKDAFNKTDHPLLPGGDTAPWCGGEGL